jgi:hypothetical protein
MYMPLSTVASEYPQSCYWARAWYIWLLSFVCWFGYWKVDKMVPQKGSAPRAGMPKEGLIAGNSTGGATKLEINGERGPVCPGRACGVEQRE